MIKEKLKDKNVRIVLIVLVAILWGFIILRIIKMVNPAVPTNNTLPIYHQEINERNFIADTFSLSLNYPDPFLKGPTYNRPKVNFTKNAVQKTDNKKISKKTPVITNCVWGDIKYGGFIRGNNDKQYTVLLRVNNKTYFVKENDNIENMVVKKYYNDSIILQQDKCIRTFYRNKK